MKNEMKFQIKRNLKKENNEKLQSTNTHTMIIVDRFQKFAQIQLTAAAAAAVCVAVHSVENNMRPQILPLFHQFRQTCFSFIKNLQTNKRKKKLSRIERKNNNNNHSHNKF